MNLSELVEHTIFLKETEDGELYSYEFSIDLDGDAAIEMYRELGGKNSTLIEEELKNRGKKIIGCTFTIDKSFMDNEVAMIFLEFISRDSSGKVESFTPPSRLRPEEADEELITKLFRDLVDEDY